MIVNLRNFASWRADRARRKAARRLKASKRAEAGYVLAIAAVLRGTHRAAFQVLEREHFAAPELRHDGKDEDKDRGLGPDFQERLFEWQKPRVEQAFDDMAKHVDKAAAEGLSLVGINPRHVAGVASAMVGARARNVALIRGASKDFLDQVREVLDETEGQHPDAIRALLEKRAGVSRSRGQLIARDQTLKMNSAIVQHRARSAGVVAYQWSGSLDERERPMHRALEGMTFSWDSPPETNEDGDRNNPGEDFQCRCVPLPVIDELGDPAGAGEPEEEAPEAGAEQPPEGGDVPEEP